MTPDLPKTFTPHRGIMSLAERLARAAEKKLGVEFWDGSNGLGAVVDQKLSESGVPNKPIALTGDEGVMTPRSLAEQAGFIKKKKRAKVGKIKRVV